MKAQNKLDRLWASYLDLSESKGCLQALATFIREPALEPGRVSEGLWSWSELAFITAAVVSYARPFTGSDGTGGNDKLDATVTKVLSLPQKGLHKALLDARKSMVAHSDYGQFVALHDIRKQTRVSTITGPILSIGSDEEGRLTYGGSEDHFRSHDRAGHLEEVSTPTQMDEIYPGGRTMRLRYRRYDLGDAVLVEITSMIDVLLEEISRRIEHQESLLNNDPGTKE